MKKTTAPSPDHYAQKDRNRVRRSHQRAAYDKATVHAMFDSLPLCIVSYLREHPDQPGRFLPFATPTLQWREGDRLYWHGSSASRMIRSLEDGVDACVSVAKLDGMVMARSAFHHSCNYRSAIAYGRAYALDDGEKLAALQQMMDDFFPGRWDQLRPVNPQEMKATTVIAMDIEDAVAKSRTGGPIDDAEDYDWPVWAGVLPVSDLWGAPEADDRLADPSKPIPKMRGS